MLYILLIIIAIGVLLLSEIGKGLLSLFVGLAIIAGGLFIAFWVVVMVFGLFTSDTAVSFYNRIPNILGGLIILVFLYFVLITLIGFYNKTNSKMQKTKEKILAKYPRIISFWRKFKKII